MGQPGSEFALYAVVLGHSGLAPKVDNHYRVALLCSNFLSFYLRFIAKPTTIV